MAKRPPSKAPEDRTERRIKFYLGVFFLLSTFIYIFIVAISQGTPRELSLPDWKYAGPFVAVAFIVVYQSDKADILAIFRIFFGGASRGMAKGIAEALKQEESSEEAEGTEDPEGKV